MASTSGQAQPAKKKPRQPRIDWNDVEIDALIAIWGEPEIQESIPRHKQVMSDFRLLALTKFDVS